MQSTANPTPCRIIVANRPRLLREMLHQVLQRIPSLQVVAETADLGLLPWLIAATGAQWVIVSLTGADAIPIGIEAVWHVHPALHILALAVDGSHAELGWTEFQRTYLPTISLDELVYILCSPASWGMTSGYGTGYG